MHDQTLTDVYSIKTIQHALRHVTMNGNSLGGIDQEEDGSKIRLSLLHQDYFVLCLDFLRHSSTAPGHSYSALPSHLSR